MTLLNLFFIENKFWLCQDLHVFEKKQTTTTKKQIECHLLQILPCALRVNCRLTLLLLNTTCPVLANSVDPDQLASSEEANWSGSTLFVTQYVNLNQQSRSSNLKGWKLEMWHLNLFWQEKEKKKNKFMLFCCFFSQGVKMGNANFLGDWALRPSFVLYPCMKRKVDENKMDTHMHTSLAPDPFFIFLFFFFFFFFFFFEGTQHLYSL